MFVHTKPAAFLNSVSRHDRPSVDITGTDLLGSSLEVNLAGNVLCCGVQGRDAVTCCAGIIFPTFV